MGGEIGSRDNVLVEGLFSVSLLNEKKWFFKGLEPLITRPAHMFVNATVAICFEYQMIQSCGSVKM